MIHSMTGFGKASLEINAKRITAEIRSLNSKQLDLNTRFSSLLRDKELEFRSLITQRLERGKVDFSLYVETSDEETESVQINSELIGKYYRQLQQVVDDLGIAPPEDWLYTLVRMPDVTKTLFKEIEEDEWKQINSIVVQAIENLIDFRRQEGDKLETLFRTKIGNIEDLLAQVEPFENDRVDKVRIRLTEALEASAGRANIDENRLEQELIFYIEKLDINEEKHRLSNHLRYFIETLEGKPGQGKKLGFIGQEIGREINTLGSKANHAEIQRIVVQMKDELEQIKEQILNAM